MALSELAVEGSLPTPVCKKFHLVHERTARVIRDGKTQVRVDVPWRVPVG